MFAMVDCNNFYASCERVFRPDLKYQPIAILSNNDGCVISRSAECKALGLKMGEPMFKAKSLIRQHGIQVFSSNYPLYADISNRVMSTLEEMVPDVEVYSIDEAFLSLIVNGETIVAAGELTAFGQHIKQRVQQYVGMPVCVGIAPSKTLAKLANFAAKTYPSTLGVVDLSDPIRQRRLMAKVPVGEVWGVGRRSQKRLRSLNIHTALDLCDAPATLLRKHFSVVLERTIQELRGLPCVELETHVPIKQHVLCSRSFGEKVTSLEELSIALSSYVEVAARKVRQEKCMARALTVFIKTNRHSRHDRQHSMTASEGLLMPTNSTPELNKPAQYLLRQHWKPGCAYQKAGIILHDLVSAENVQTNLFAAQQSQKSQNLMNALDAVNHRYHNALCYASALPTKQYSRWRMKQNELSPAYTTRWADIPRV